MIPRSTGLPPEWEQARKTLDGFFYRIPTALVCGLVGVKGGSVRIYHGDAAYEGMLQQAAIEFGPSLLGTRTGSYDRPRKIVIAGDKFLTILVRGKMIPSAALVAICKIGTEAGLVLNELRPVLRDVEPAVVTEPERQAFQASQDNPEASATHSGLNALGAAAIGSGSSLRIVAPGAVTAGSGSVHSRR